MEKLMNVAKSLDTMYLKQYGDHMDEMKMHKLMYFSQRESLMLTGELLFEGDFYGWKFGPVLKEVRNEYKKAKPFAKYEDSVLEETRELLRGVMDRYGSLSSWKLSSLSHKEFSWLKARNGLKSGENGNVKMLVEAMKVDALKELAARKAALE